MRFAINHFKALTITGMYLGNYGKFMLACTLYKISDYPKKYKNIKKHLTHELHTYI